MSEQGEMPAEGTSGRQVRDRDRAFMRRLAKVQIGLMDVTRGRLLGQMGGNPLLILTTTGWRSGKQFSNPVVGIADGGDWLIVASHGGASSNPRWLRNLADNPRVTVRRAGGGPVPMTARILPAAERAQWWPQLTRAYPSYAKMQTRTDRELAIVRLSPDGDRD
jgi:deazaflavin-dependent oxidoreductase (nitroreductase family)